MIATAQDAREQLIARRDRLQRLRREMVSTEDDLLSEREADWEDRSVSERSARVLEIVGDRQHRQLQAIDHALSLIESGRWGICDVCGCHIDPYRLEARPEATICSDCATAW